MIASAFTSGTALPLSRSCATANRAPELCLTSSDGVGKWGDAVNSESRARLATTPRQTSEIATPVGLRECRALAIIAARADPPTNLALLGRPCAPVLARAVPRLASSAPRLLARGREERE